MPLWCGDLGAHYDNIQIIQQLFHVMSHIANSKNCNGELKKLLKLKTVVQLASKFHRTDVNKKFLKL